MTKTCPDCHAEVLSTPNRMGTTLTDEIIDLSLSEFFDVSPRSDWTGAQRVAMRKAIQTPDWRSKLEAIYERMVRFDSGNPNLPALKEVIAAKMYDEFGGDLRDALGQIAGKNDLSGVPDDDLESAARNALYECELIARAALAATPAETEDEPGYGGRYGLQRRPNKENK